MAETSEMVRELTITDATLNRIRSTATLELRDPALRLIVRGMLHKAGFDLDPVDDADYSDPKISGRWECWRNEADMSRTFRQYPEALPSPPDPA